MINEKIIITAWKGNPRIYSNGKKSLLSEGMDLKDGNRIVTGKQDELILAHNKTRISIGNGSDFSVNQLQRKDGVLTALSHLRRGQAVFSVEKGGYRSFMVDTLHGRITVVGTVFSVFVKKAIVHVLVYRGRIYFRRKSSRIRRLLSLHNGITVTGKSLIFHNEADRMPRFKKHYKEMKDLAEKEEITNAKKHDSHKKNKAKINKKNYKRTRVIKRAPVNKLQIKVSKKTVRIYLKNGSSVKGVIIFKEKKAIRLRTSFTVMRLGIDKIQRIEEVQD